MTGIILAAGYATRMYPLTLNTPKPLLPVQGKAILTGMFCDLDKNCGLDRHILVSNHKFYGAFEKWLENTDCDHPVSLVDDGSTSDDQRLGAVKDLLLATRTLSAPDDLFVCAADNILDFSLSALVDYFAEKSASVALCYREPDIQKRRRSGVILRAEDGRVLDFEEKPDAPKGEYVVPPFYIISKKDFPLIEKSIEDGINPDAPGSLIGYLVKNSVVHAMDMPGKRYDVGNLETYERIKGGLNP